MSSDIDSSLPIRPAPEKGYALSGKIMLSAIIILFAVVIFMAVLHLYARWYLLRLRRLQLQRRQRHRRRTHIVFYVDNHPNSATDAANIGLEAEVLKSLPLFAYSSKTHPEVLECAVCLSEFEENETVRFLPKCSHSFHTECIDMWFRSHSTCPLCRSPVELLTEPVENRGQAPVAVDEPGSSSGDNTTSLGVRRKGLDMVGVRIEVPRRTDFEDELPVSSPASHGFRSPGTRLLSIKRLLSMSKKSPVGTPCGAATSCGSVGAAQLDLESGRRDELAPESTRVTRQGKRVGEC